MKWYFVFLIALCFSASELDDYLHEAFNCCLGMDILETNATHVNNVMYLPYHFMNMNGTINRFAEIYGDYYPSKDYFSSEVFQQTPPFSTMLYNSASFWFAFWSALLKNIVHKITL